MSKTAVTKKPLTTERQTELMRVVDECFGNFAKRQQPYYALEGMATAHIALHAIADFVTLRAFWPKELVRRTFEAGTVYQLEPDTMSKVQSAVLSALDQLEEKGWIEKIGNENERRWRPVKTKEEKQTKEVYSSTGDLVGTAILINGRWVF